MKYEIIAEVAVNYWYTLDENGDIETYIDDGGADNDNVTGFVILDEDNQVIDDGFTHYDDALAALKKLEEK